MYRGYKMLKVLKILKYLFLLTLINCSETCSDLQTIYNVARDPEGLEKPLVYESFDFNETGNMKSYSIKPKYNGKYRIVLEINGEINKKKLELINDGEILIEYLNNEKVVSSTKKDKLSSPYGTSRVEQVPRKDASGYVFAYNVEIFFKSFEMDDFRYPLNFEYEENLSVRITVLKPFTILKKFKTKVLMKYNSNL